MNGMKRRLLDFILVFVFVLSCALSFSSCEETALSQKNESVATQSYSNEKTDTVGESESAGTKKEEGHSSFDYSEIASYQGEPYVIVNDNVPYFTESEITDRSFESYPELDSLGRCGPCVASVCVDIMPTEDRGNISSVKPTGWHSVKYDFVDGDSLYNRCHLIGFQLAGENANWKNLITGTRYMNVDGMLPFENMVADYVKETENHVMYRVTPVFVGEELVARGVLMEALSVEDGGDGIGFCVFCYNVQPGVRIDYLTGASMEDVSANQQGSSPSDQNGKDYVLNTNSKKFHESTCSSVSDISAKNRQDFFGTRAELIDMGYVPCKQCDP